MAQEVEALYSIIERKLGRQGHYSRAMSRHIEREREMKRGCGGGSPWWGRGGRGERRAARRKLAAAARVIRRVPFSVSSRMVPSAAA